MSTMIAPSQEQQIRNDIFAACVVERMRQIEKGYDRVHDDEHGDGPLSGLAAAVAAQSADVAPVLMLAEASRMTSTWQIRPLTASGRASYMGFWRAHGDAMKALLLRAVGRLRFIPGCQGKLFGALTKLVHYPDLASVGNADGCYELRCPATMPEVTVGDLTVGPNAVLMRLPLLARDALLPKEERMLARVQAELDEGRGCLVLPVSVQLLERYAWLFEQAGIEAALLVADKVPPAKREAWIEAQLGRKGRRVLIVNPDAVRTGLNGLAEHLSTAIAMQNPECKPITDRQVIDRLHRPRQRHPVRAVRMVYDHPVTLAAHRLLMHKVGVSLAVDGLDPEAVYAAAGIGDQITAGLSVGHQLYRLLREQADEDEP